MIAPNPALPGAVVYFFGLDPSAILHVYNVRGELVAGPLAPSAAGTALWAPPPGASGGAYACVVSHPSDESVVRILALLPRR